MTTYLVIWERPRLLSRVGWCALLPGAALIGGFMGWYRFVHGPTDVFAVSMRQAREFAFNPPWSSLPEIGLTYAVYLGSFVAALAVALPWSAWWQLGRRSVRLGLFAVWLLANLIAYFYLERGLLFPYIRNVITPFGLFVPSTYLLGSKPLIWGTPTAWVITLLSVLGVISLLQRLSEASWQESDRPRWVTMRLLCMWLAWQLAYIGATTPLLFDRHLLILAPSSVLLFVVLSPPRTRWSLARFAVVLLPMTHYSLAGNHDIHAESRLAFQAGYDLITEGVPAARINGGYAFDGWHLYDIHSGPVPVRPLPPWWGMSFRNDWRNWQVMSETLLNYPESAWWSGPVRPPGEIDYVLSLSAPGSSPVPPKFLKVRSYCFVSGWSGRTKHLFVLRRIHNADLVERAATETPR